MKQRTDTSYKPVVTELVLALGCVVLIAGIGIASLFTPTYGPSRSLLNTAAEATAKPAAAVGQAQPTAKPAQTPAPTSVAAAAVPTTAATEGPAAPTESAATPTAKPAASTATAAPATAEATPTPEYITYTVQEGDILYGIAKRYKVTIEDILAINEIDNPESLGIGDIIFIPRVP